MGELLTLSRDAPFSLDAHNIHARTHICPRSTWTSQEPQWQMINPFDLGPSLTSSSSSCLSSSVTSPATPADSRDEVDPFFPSAFPLTSQRQPNSPSIHAAACALYGLTREQMQEAVQMAQQWQDGSNAAKSKGRAPVTAESRRHLLAPIAKRPSPLVIQSDRLAVPASSPSDR